MTVTDGPPNAGSTQGAAPPKPAPPKPAPPKAAPPAAAPPKAAPPSTAPPGAAPPGAGRRHATSDEEDTMKRWHDEARRMRAGHSKAATRYQEWGRGLGAFSAALTSFVGGSLFATLTAEKENLALQVITGTFSVAAALLVVIMTSLGFSAKSDQHHDASVKFGGVVHGIEASHATQRTEDEWAAQLKQIVTDLNDCYSDTPILPGRYFDYGQKWVRDHPLELWTVRA